RPLALLPSATCRSRKAEALKTTGDWHPADRALARHSILSGSIGQVPRSREKKRGASGAPQLRPRPFVARRPRAAPTPDVRALRPAPPDPPENLPTARRRRPWLEQAACPPACGAKPCAARRVGRMHGNQRGKFFPR